MIKVSNIEIGGNNKLTLIAGPCVVESREIVYQTAVAIKKITDKLEIPFIFKSSYKKANRTSLNSFTGLGDETALSILSEVKRDLKLPILTDVHSISEVENAAMVADVLQIPAFLSRQTELLMAAGKTGKAVNIKKGQFLAPDEMEHAVKKIESTGNKNILLTERGSSFGYHNLVVDMRSLVIMKNFGYPVVMDATHAVQIPGKNTMSGGEPAFIKPIAKAATAVGIDAIFLEVHPDPANALSDAASQLPLNELEELLSEIIKIDELVKSF